MESSTVYIRSGFANTLVSSNKPFHIPFFQSIQTLELISKVELQGSTELGLMSKDRLLLDINISLKTRTKQDQESVLKAFTQGNERKDLLSSAILETLREEFKNLDFNDISSNKEKIEIKLKNKLDSYDIENFQLLNFDIERTGLDEYDLDNIIHFEAAKEIVTRIARVQIKDKEFIDKCRKTISYFDIVDE